MRPLNISEEVGDDKQPEDVPDVEAPQSTETDDAKGANAQHSMDDASIRAGWLKGSRCEVFSNTAQEWLSARVVRVFRDDEGEWLEVKYSGKSLKQLQRDSADIRPHVE